jgi:hypothetical protein
VLDLSESIAEVEAEIRQITDEEWEEMLMYISEAIEEAFAYIEYYMADMEEFFAEIWAEIQEAVTVHAFNFGYNVLANGYNAYLNFAVTIAEDGIVADIAFSFTGEVTNINTAAKPVMPILTAQNSFDLLNFDLLAALGW